MSHFILMSPGTPEKFFSCLCGVFHSVSWPQAFPRQFSYMSCRCKEEKRTKKSCLSKQHVLKTPVLVSGYNEEVLSTLV